MKSNNDVFIRYDYVNGGSICMTDNIVDTITDHQDRKALELGEWLNVDDDKPFVDSLEVTYMELDVITAEPTMIFFSERL